MTGTLPTSPPSQLCHDVAIELKDKVWGSGGASMVWAGSCLRQRTEAVYPETRYFEEGENGPVS